MTEKKALKDLAIKLAKEKEENRRLEAKIEQLEKEIYNLVFQQEGAAK